VPDVGAGVADDVEGDVGGGCGELDVFARRFLALVLVSWFACCKGYEEYSP
jgi:hypothetical protein